MSTTPSLKKPKVEPVSAEEGANSYENGVVNSRSEQEEALLALVEHRSKEVEHVRRRVAYYQSELEKAEKRLCDSECRLARHRCQDNTTSSDQNFKTGHSKLKSDPVMLDCSAQDQVRHRKELVIPAIDSACHSGQDDTTPSSQNPKAGNIKSENGPVTLECSTPDQVRLRKELVIPAINSTGFQPKKSASFESEYSTSSDSQPNACGTKACITPVKSKTTSTRISCGRTPVDLQDKKAKRKLEQNEHTELIPLIRSSECPGMVQCCASSHISSEHKRRLRSIILSPERDQLFVTSALDGMVNLWQIEARRTGASLLSSTDCFSPKQRRWPEDIAWHPLGHSLFSVYSADGGDSQVSVLDLNKTRANSRVTFLEPKPHVKGIINGIIFVPWSDSSFVTGGSDHAVIYWTEVEGMNSWKSKSLHRNHHTSAVMGVAGSHLKPTVLSAGADKRIIGYDVRTERAEFKYQIDSKCMSILPNPRDFNLFMVQTATPKRQLRLFDMRLRQTEIHAFGWKQENSESQSALINQAWSPDGLYLTSGSADPVIHIFDIRHNASEPSQSIKAHQKRVFKAVWHSSIPLLISISSDLNIGLHTIR